MKKIHLKEKQRNVVMNIIAIVIACIFLFPIYWIVINSFKTDGEIFANPPTLWPRSFTLDAYKAQLSNLSVTFKNSMIIAIGSLCISLLLCRLLMVLRNSR
jgi:multiple sugar transport system permease protein